MKVFKLEAEILEEKFVVNSLFGMEAFVSTAEIRGETLGYMFANIGKIADNGTDTDGGANILKFAKQITYQGYLSYCSLKDIEPSYSEKKVAIIFDNAGEIDEVLTRWSAVFTSTLPTSKDTAKIDIAKKKE